MAIKKNRALLNDERNKKIEEMSMEEVRQYLCMKHMQNPDKCDGCASMKTCAAGQRVMVLKKERAEREAQEDAKNKQRGWRKEQSEEYIREILAADDPREYLMEKEGLTYAKAAKKLDNWKRNHSDLFVGITWRKRHAGNNKYTKKGKEQTEETPVIKIDEVSVEDFLKEINAEPSTEAEPVAEPKLQNDEGTVNFSEVNACGVPIELIRKEAEIGVQMDKIKQQIDELQSKYNMLKKAQNAINLTMTVFSDTSADFKQTLSMMKKYNKGE